MLSSKIRVKVQSVKAVKDPENREAYQIEFVEERLMPPMVATSSLDVPEEITQVVTQVTKSFQVLMPGVQSRSYKRHRMTLILTGEELESFNIKPYPNQSYILTITDRGLMFEEAPL